MTKAETLQVADANTYVISIGPSAFVIEFKDDSKDAGLAGTRSLIVAATRDLAHCVNECAESPHFNGHQAALGVELLLGLATALDEEIENQASLAAD